MSEYIIVPAKDDFLNEIVRYFFERFDSCNRIAVKILLPTTRSCRILKQRFLTYGRSTIIPEIICPLSQKKVASNDLEIATFDSVIPILDICKIIIENNSFYSKFSFASNILQFVEQMFFEKLSIDDVLACCEKSMYFANNKLAKYIDDARKLDSVKNYLNKKVFPIVSLEKEKNIINQFTIIAGFNFSHKYIMDVLRDYAASSTCIFIQQENLFGLDRFNRYLGLNNPEVSRKVIEKTIYLLEQENIYEEAENIAILAKKYLLENRDVTIVSNNKNFNSVLEKSLSNFGVHPDNSSGVNFSSTIIGKFLLNVLNCFLDNFSIRSILLLFSSIENIACKYDNNYHISIQKFYENLGYLYVKHKTIFGNFIDNYNVIASNNNDAFVLGILYVILKNYQIFHKDKDNIGLFLHIFRCIFYEILEKFLPDNKRIDIVDEIFNLLFKLELSNLNTEDAIFLIRNLINSISERRPVGFTENIKILAPIEAQLIKLDVCIVCNFNDSTWKKDRENFFISNEIRENLSLDWANRRNLNLMDLVFTLASSSETMIFSNSAIGQTNEQNMCSYLEGFDANFEKIDLECFNKCKINMKQKNKENMESFNKNNGIPVGLNDISNRNIELSVTDICDIVNNPYEFYAKKILKLPIINLEINHDNFRALRGSIIHKSIEYVEKNIEKFFSKNRIDLIKNCIIEFADTYKISDLYKKDLLICLDKILIYYNQNIENKAETFIEKNGEIVVELNNNVHVKIKCIADRVDRCDDGFVITDFKTGKLPSVAEIINFQKPQIGIEALIFSQNEKIKDLLLLQLGKNMRNQKKITLDDIIKNQDIKNIGDFLEIYRKELTNILNKFFAKKNNFEQSLDAHYNEYSHLGRIKEYC